MESENQAFFDWYLFLPNQWPHELIIRGLHSTADLSALFIWLTLGLFLIAAIWLIWRGVLSLRAIRFLSGLLTRAESDKLAVRRRDLRKLAETRIQPGHLWLALDATWVESADGEHLYQTTDAGTFFNPQSLAKGIVDNRLFAAIPGILTAFGILGTFVGLQIGLSSLDLSSPQVLSQSIVPLIQGAAVAFSTSVWGTAASVIFNVLEKSLEQILRRRIESLRQRANRLTRAHLPEQTLLNIEQANVQAENALKGLAEQIGNQMQEALLQVPRQIQTGIEASMTPAVEKLVQAAETLAQKQGNQAEQALAGMIEKFVNSVAESGETSRRGLENASAELGTSLSHWSSSMEGFLNRLEQRNEHFEGQMGNLMEQGQALRQEAGVSQQFMAAVAGELQQGGELLRQATRDLEKFAREVHQAGSLLGETQLQVARLAENSARVQQDSGEKLAKIADTLEHTQQSLQASSEALAASAASAKSGFEELSKEQKEFLDGLRKALNNLRKQVGQMMHDYATDVEEQTRSRLEQWNIQTQEFSRNMVGAVQSMHEILGEIETLLAQRRGKDK